MSSNCPWICEDRLGQICKPGPRVKRWPKWDKKKLWNGCKVQLYIQNIIHNITEALNSNEWKKQFQGWGKLLSLNPRANLQGGYYEIRRIPLWIEVLFIYFLVKRCSTLFPKLNWWSPNSEQLSWLLRNVVQLSLNKGAGRYKNLVGPKPQICEIVGIFPSKMKNERRRKKILSKPRWG